MLPEVHRPDLLLALEREDDGAATGPAGVEGSEQSRHRGPVVG